MQLAASASDALGTLALTSGEQLIATADQLAALRADAAACKAALAQLVQQTAGREAGLRSALEGMRLRADAAEREAVLVHEKGEPSTQQEASCLYSLLAVFAFISLLPYTPATLCHQELPAHAGSYTRWVVILTCLH